MCYWFFRLNVCAAVAFLLKVFNTSCESLEKNRSRFFDNYFLVVGAGFIVKISKFFSRILVGASFYCDIF